MQEKQWLNYNNAPKLEKRPFMKAMCFEEEKLVLNFLSKNNNLPKIKVIFDNVLSFRVTNESFTLKTIASIYQQEKLQKTFNSNAWIFMSKNTCYLDWLHNESDGLYKNHVIKHFMIVSIENIIDVLSFDDPTLKF